MGSPCRELPEAFDSRCHVRGVERAGDSEWPQSGALGRVGGERGELLESAGRDDLAGGVHVGRGEPELGQLRQHRLGVAAKDRGHAGRGRGRRAGHRTAALTNQDKGRFRRQDAGQCGRGDLSDAVPGDRADIAGDVVEGVREPPGRLPGDAELRLAVREKH